MKASLAPALTLLSTSAFSLNAHGLLTSSKRSFCRKPQHPQHHPNRLSNGHQRPDDRSPVPLLSSSSSTADDTKKTSFGTIATEMRNPTVTKSALLMTFAMALHFFSYEFLRSAMLTLFTSEGGFASSSSYTLAMACVTPTSVFFLMIYGNVLNKRGSKIAIRQTGLCCVLALSFIWFLVSLVGIGTVGGTSGRVAVMMRKIVIWISFVFQNSYAHLLYTQHWSFLGSVMSKGEGLKYFSAIAGVSSIFSMVAGMLVGGLVNLVGLGGLLGVGCVALGCSVALAEWGYVVSEKGGFAPAKKVAKKKDGTEGLLGYQLPYHYLSSLGVVASSLWFGYISCSLFVVDSDNI